ncbi:MAG: hypothetical protein RLZZ371_387 [Pseudomonadota bacterium]|jgi:urease accessory protein
MKSPFNSLPTKAALAVLASTLCSWANAHTGVDAHGHTGFLMGFGHPLGGLDHVAAMVAVGLWSALAARRAGAELLWGPLGSASLLLVGAVMGLQGITLPAVEPMIASSLLVIGLLVVSRLHLPGLAAALLVGGFAMFHGVAHGLELAGNASAWLTLAGLLSTTVLLHLTGLGLGWVLRHNSIWLARSAGAAVAASGGALLLQWI